MKAYILYIRDKEEDDFRPVAISPDFDDLQSRVGWVHGGVLWRIEEIRTQEGNLVREGVGETKMRPMASCGCGRGEFFVRPTHDRITGPVLMAEAPNGDWVTPPYLREVVADGKWINPRMGEPIIIIKPERTEG